ncbi:MAG: hypothetical protein GF353_28425 [Candidatus Lokiarchaeota archaeon]|nr:hypothetical protein [Candidatus Lokiarchaeota archaeon]
MTTYFSLLLHIYQPPTQDIDILKTINKDCYKPLFSMLENYEHIQLCLNISGVLIDLLYEFGLGDTMDLLKNLVAENKVEIVGTAKYHPILPLIPKKEAYHQIRLNEELNKEEFGSIWKGKGFFPPEMAISSSVAKIVRSLGYKWVLMSGIACPVDWPYDKIYCSPNGLQLYFRDDIHSNKISFKQITAKEFVSSLRKLFKRQDKNENDTNSYSVIAMDGETFGHHIKNYEKTFLAQTFELISEEPEKKTEEDIKMVSISKLDNYFPISSKKIIPKESSWSTTKDDLTADIPYPLWKHPDNNIHRYYWKIMKSLNNLMNLCDKLDLTEDWNVENHYNTARYFYDKGLYSCPIWWANPIRGTWSPNLTYKGLELLMRAALNAQLALVYAGKSEGDGYFDSISYYHGLLLMELYTITQKTC